MTSLIEETTIAAAALPVEQFKAHLRLGTGFADDALQDPVLESFLRAAIAAVEARTGKILLQRNFSWSVTRWRDGAIAALPVAPVQALLAVDVVDADDLATPQSLADYRLIKDGHSPQIAARGGCLPTPPTHGSVRIGFTAGFASAFADLPADLSHAVMLLAAHYYENRNDIGRSNTSLPFGVEVLLECYKSIRILGGGVSS